MKTTVRTLAAALFCSLALPALAQAGSAASSRIQAAGPIQVVYHVSEGSEQASHALANVYNHLKAEPGTRIVVVALGMGVDFLLEGARDKSGKAYQDKIAFLASQGVQFRVCNNTLKAREIDPAKLVLEAKVVSSGVAEIARLQAREGFVYIKP